MARDLNDTLMFVRVVEHGSFTSAARSLGLPKTNVSRKVQELEERLGAQLLHRTTRRLGLTEAGKVYFELCQRIARDLDEAEGAVGQLQGGPRGWLRVTAPYEIGNEWIAPLIPELSRRHPEMRIELVLDAFNSDPLDLIDKEIDVALRAGPLPDSTLAARRLAVLHTHVYATQAYVDRFGEPSHPDELIRHRTLAVARHYRRNNGYVWPLQDGSRAAEFPIDPVFVANDPSSLRVAMLADEGLMLAGDLMARRYAASGTLRRVMSAWSGPQFDLNVVFPRGRVQSPKVRAFVDFLLEQLSRLHDGGGAQATSGTN
ncbi:LysR family transcriptional regulator [Lysobacter terrae]